eukprot:TRINITY_DN17625_c0_g1_i1.p1 TRINITY_DN17625_c0_g1~~TRINITY_DN17625_c0_g1_i1.p1  ORF type:complete len:247 (-),score=60.84 TRINITY_DN17625_c0_g1_i1:125-865(-)
MAPRLSGCRLGAHGSVEGLAAECQALVEKRMAVEEELGSHMDAGGDVARALVRVSAELRAELQEEARDLAKAREACVSLRHEVARREKKVQGLEVAVLRSETTAAFRRVEARRRVEAELERLQKAVAHVDAQIVRVQQEDRSKCALAIQMRNEHISRLEQDKALSERLKKETTKVVLEASALRAEAQDLADRAATMTASTAALATRPWRAARLRQVARFAPTMASAFASWWWIAGPMSPGGLLHWS